MKPKEKRKILVLYTGGTAGMHKEYPNAPLKAGSLEDLRKNIPEADELPYDITWEEFFPGGRPIDSSEASLKLFNQMAKKIQEGVSEYDGVVVLYGTDTMGPSAGYLSYIFEGLNKPVIFTGAMIPAVEKGSDAQANIVDAIEVAAQSGNEIPALNEVAVVFNKEIFRGNTVFKYSSRKDSPQPMRAPGHETLGDIQESGKIVLKEKELLPETKEKFTEVNKLRTGFSPIAIDINPFTSEEVIEAFVARRPPAVFIYGIGLTSTSERYKYIKKHVPSNIPIFYHKEGAPPDPEWIQLPGIKDFQQAHAKATYIINRTPDIDEMRALAKANLRGEGEGPIVTEREILKYDERGAEMAEARGKRR